MDWHKISCKHVFSYNIIEIKKFRGDFMHLSPEVFRNLVRHNECNKVKFSIMSKLNGTFVYRVLYNEKSSDKALIAR